MPCSIRHFGHHDTLTRIRRGGAEEQAVVFGGRQAGRGGRGRNHHDAVGHGHVLQDRAGHAGAVGAHDRLDAVGGDQPFGGSRGGRGVDAGRVAAKPVDRRAAKKRAGFAHFGHRQFGAAGHLWRQRFKRAGEAQDDADLDFFAVAGREYLTCTKGSRRGCQ